MSLIEVAAFRSRPTVSVFAEHGIRLIDPDIFLVRGERLATGACSFTEAFPVSEPELARSDEGLAITSVQLAVDFPHCEALVERGLREQF